MVQEIDIPTGLLLFQWDSLDHVPVTDSYARLPPSRTRDPFDYFHANCVDVDRDGNLIVSGRNTWTIYKIDRHTGAVIWRLGGVDSSFRLAPRTYWAFQHDVRVQARNDLYITLFDNESGTYEVRKQSGAVKLRLDLKHMTATQVHRDSHSPPTLAPFAGSLQQLPGHTDFVGWGARPYISEYGPGGKLLFDARFVGQNASYRAYLLPWNGRPTERDAAQPRRHEHPPRAGRVRELERRHGRVVMASTGRPEPEFAAACYHRPAKGVRDRDHNRAVRRRCRAGAGWRAPRDGSVGAARCQFWAKIDPLRLSGPRASRTSRDWAKDNVSARRGGRSLQPV